MTPITQTLIEELQRVPEDVQREVLDYLRFLKSRRVAGDPESLLPLAERAWAADWDSPAEDEAWQDL